MDTVLVVIKEMRNRHYGHKNDIWYNVLTTPEGLEEWEKYEKIWTEEVEPLQEQKEKAGDKLAKKRNAKGIVFGLKAAEKKYNKLVKELHEKKNIASEHFRQFDSVKRDIENFAYDITEATSFYIGYRIKRNVVLDILRKNAGHPFSDSLKFFREEIRKYDYDFKTNKFKREERDNRKIDNLNKKLGNQKN